MEGVLKFIAAMVFIQTIIMLVPPVAVYYVVQSDSGKAVASKASSILNNTDHLMQTTNHDLPSQMKKLQRISDKVDKMLPKTNTFISKGIKLSDAVNKKMSVMQNVKHIAEMLDDTPMDEGLVHHMLNMTRIASKFLNSLNFTSVMSAIQHVDIISKQMESVFGEKNVNLTQHVLKDADSALSKMNTVFSKLV